MMTKEEMRVAIAKKCGATWSEPIFGHDLKWSVTLSLNKPFKWDSSWAGEAPPFEQCNKVYNIPNYPEDLNAMHEAETFIGSINFGLAFQCALEKVAAYERHDKRSRWNVYHATASQRAEAFCRVFWPERFQ